MTTTPSPSGLAVVVTDGPGAAPLQHALEDAGIHAVLVDPAGGEEAVRSAIGKAAGTRGAVVLAEGAAARVALRGASTEVTVQGVALLAPELDGETAGLLADWPGLRSLVVVGTGDRRLLADAVSAYCQAPQDTSELFVLPEGQGPAREALAERVATWARDTALAVDQHDVVLDTEDGWRIHGTLSRPAAPPGRIPGVVLLHSGRSDRAVFWRLQRLLARRSMAVLNIDWRGRGLSTNRGTYFELSKDERALGALDARSAVQHLRSLPEVDPDRIALVGVVHGAEHAVGGAVGDPGIRGLVLLTGYMPRSDEERALLVDGSVAVYSVTCEGHGPVTDSMQALHHANPHPSRRLRVYPGGAIGYQLFELDEHLELDITSWLSELLDS